MKLRDTGWNIGDFIEFQRDGSVIKGVIKAVVNGIGFMLEHTDHLVYLFRDYSQVTEVFENV